ncbi:hypothetical protein QR680_017506 [Steinernema hermaphroditum]|uniref:Peroxin-1 n=1 Tax=Steinernema hermaphroditum TaxID=289476 RepID=A0AA39LNS3_9BILA|nr:hypothetical protein QR680_017506 [Steinernema hermaphroditum]
MSKNGPRRTLPCFLALHRREHCFGYFGSEKNEGESSLATKTLYECHSCANPERRIVLEVAEARRAGPKSHLYVSDRFAYCNGMDEGEELILEEVVSATMCDRVVIEPATTNDFEILQCSRGRVELVFLDQLRFVAKGMHFPIWVEQSVCIVFRALSVEPPMSGHVVRLTTNTEVEISVPSSMSRSDSALASPPVRASDQAMPGDILSSLSTDSPLDALLSHCDFPADEDSTSPEVFRVLFRRFFEERNEFGSHNVILSMSTEETGSVPKFQIVEVERESLQSGAIWIRIPVGVCSELYRRVKGVLADRKGHCIVSNNLRKAGFHDGFRIRVRPYSRKHCVLLSEVLVESCYEVNESTLTKSLQSHFESAIVSVTGFCLMDRHGLPLKLNVAGQIISVLLKPTSSCVSQGLSSTRRCFVFSTSKLPSFKYESVPKKEESTENESMKLVEHEMQSFGSRNSRSNCTPLMCQSFTIATLVSNVVFSLKEQSRGRAHYLLTGARLSGKSTHLRLLAVELERHPMTVFSKFIDCRSWKGKSAETIEKRLNADIGHLKQRQPALLLLDNIDFFSLKNEGEERVIAMEKFFFTIRDVIEKSGILMCATARSTHSVNKILTRSQGKRFFGNTFVIAPPDQVCS